MSGPPRHTHLRRLNPTPAELSPRPRAGLPAGELTAVRRIELRPQFGGFSVAAFLPERIEAMIPQYQTAESLRLLCICDALVSEGSQRIPLTGGPGSPARRSGSQRPPLAAAASAETCRKARS
jgi:hypothetical protein